MKAFFRKFELFFFLLFTLLFSWFPWYVGIAPEVMAMGPSIAAFIVILIVGGKKGFVELVRPFGRWRAEVSLWAVAIFGPAVLYLIGLGFFVLFGGQAPPFTMLREELNLIPLYLIMVVLMPWNGPVGEEFGWRGYLLPKFQKQYGPLLASILIGVIWGFWHLPSFFAPQGVVGVLTDSIGLVFIPLYALGTLANSIFMTWLYNRTNRSALLAGIIWHAAINFWAPVLLSDSSLVAAREGTHLPTIAPALYLTVLVAQVVGAIALGIVTGWKLGHRGKATDGRTKEK
jgi:membrane protease YdiL (CAAX protease family)